MKGKMAKTRKFSHICMLLVALLQLTTPASAQNTPSQNPAALGYSTLPANLTVAVGDPAVFRCASSASSKLTFNLYGSHGNYSLNCSENSGNSVEDIPQALYGSCEGKNEEVMAVWTIKGTSFSDNGTRVLCQQLNHPDAPPAFLHVYDSGTSYAILIGCTIGGFFGTLLVIGLSYTVLQRSETLQRCYRGKEREEDTSTIVTKE